MEKKNLRLLNHPGAYFYPARYFRLMSSEGRESKYFWARLRLESACGWWVMTINILYQLQIFKNNNTIISFWFVSWKLRNVILKVCWYFELFLNHRWEHHLFILLMFAIWDSSLVMRDEEYCSLRIQHRSDPIGLFSTYFRECDLNCWIRMLHSVCRFIIDGWLDLIVFLLHLSFTRRCWNLMRLFILNLT